VKKIIFQLIWFFYYLTDIIFQFLLQLKLFTTFQLLLKLQLTDMLTDSYFSVILQFQLQL